MNAQDRSKRTLRMPDQLARQLEQCARENGRSVNAEIVYRLQQTLTGYRR